MIGIVRLYAAVSNNKRSNGVAGVLLLVDAFFIGGHVLFLLTGFHLGDVFLISSPFGYPEYFQFGKYVLIIGFILYLALKMNLRQYMPWCVVFAVLLFDDILQLHTRFGKYFVHDLNLKPIFGLKPIDVGELLYSFVLGFLLLILLFGLYFKSTEEIKRRTLDITLLLLLYLFFAVLIDALYALFGGHMVSGMVLNVLEEGGELIVLSLICWYFYFLILTIGSKNYIYLHQFLFVQKKRDA